ncbi:hypothetical protein Rt10032_c05g2577 [Rhodotorula toruloides]|uniref:NAD(P)-binding protein n=1 Tax=Rhodotorula toruloides TaxID=5286 RepID=A0A511KDV0_RHOTO|nr:hypothetical protein Rt10032_c05g2577 [Rhodotorula toruloides]
MASDRTVYLVTGGSRGLGFGIVTLLAERENTLIFATARDPIRAKDLQELAAKHSNVIPVQLELTSESSVEALARVIDEKAGRLDVAINNAANCEGLAPALTTPISDFRDKLESNAIAPLLLFQHLYSLLMKSKQRQFVGISTAGASLTLVPHITFPILGYAASKTAMNMVYTKIAAEHANDELLSYVVHPGLVKTDSAASAIQELGLDESEALSPVASAAGVLKVIAAAKRETHSGRFWDHEGKEVPW